MAETEEVEVKEEVKVAEIVEPKTVAEVVEQNPNSIETFISQAIAEKAPIETIKEFLAIRKELKADQAKEAFTMAMATFQKDCPVIAKTKEVKNKSGQVTYRYATIDSIILQVKGVLGENSLMYDFSESRDEKTMTVTCTITHAMGHTKSSSFTVEIGTEAYMTDTQKYGARNTFAKRYAFMNVLGIATGDEDTDAREIKKPTPKLPANPKSKIMFLMKEMGYTEKAEMLEKVKELTQLDPNEAENVEEIINRLEVIWQEKNENN